MILKPPEEYSFLVDVNLPKRFSFFNSVMFIHIADIDPCMTDDKIWDYALKFNKVILTKDTDFYTKSMSAVVKPKIIYFQLGNMTLDELHRYFEMQWTTIIDHLTEASLIIAQRDKIKVIV
jgi:predicted nuclease of predicted toxin-antitoxin system